MTYERYQVRFIVERVEVDDHSDITHYAGEVYGEDGPFLENLEEAESKCRIYMGMAKQYETTLAEVTGQGNSWILVEDEVCQDGPVVGDSLSSPSALSVAILMASSLLLMGLRFFWA